MVHRAAVVLLAVVAPLAAQHDAALAHAREVNLAYAANMPSFVADETAKRSTSNSPTGKWRAEDTVQTEITFNGPRAVRRQIRRNGKPWNFPFETLPGFKWYGGFGTEIRPIFDPTCSTSIEPAGSSVGGARTLLEFRYSAPADGCFAVFNFAGRHANPPRTGHVFVDDPGGHVIRLDEQAIDFPADFGFTRREEEVRWDEVRIGDASHLLPVAANFLVVYSNGARSRIEVAYTNHRHFETSSTIDFKK